MAIVHAAVIAVDDDDVRTVFNPAPIVDAVTGPESATDGHIAVFSGSTGKIIADGGAPGGGGLLQTSTVTLTDAQIKLSPTNPVEIIAAPESGKRIIPISIDLVLNNEAGAYTNTHASKALSFEVGYAWGNTVPAYFWSDSSAAQRAGITERLFWNGSFIETDVAEFADVSNVAVTLVGYSTGGVLTGGDAANTMKVTVCYTVVDAS